VSWRWLLAAGAGASRLPFAAADAGGPGCGSREELVMGIAGDLLEQIPEPFNLEQVGCAGCAASCAQSRSAGTRLAAPSPPCC
jgi:hypothetical protein